MRVPLPQGLMLAACVAGTVLAQPAEPSAVARLKMSYPDIFQTGSSKGLRHVEASSEEAATALKSQKVWFVKLPPAGAGAAAVRLVEVEQGGASLYYLVEQGGFGGSVTQVFGPLKI